MQQIAQNNEEEQELYENFRVVVDKGQSLLRIDKFLMTRIEGISRNRLQLAAKADCIKVNNKCVKPNYRVKPLDLIQIFLAKEPKETEIVPQDIPVDIVYEDDDLIVVNKTAPMVVHPGYGNYSGTLLNALAFHFQNRNEGKNQDVKPLLVHRIDKDTTGLLLVAKNEYTQTCLAKQFFEHTIERKYNALVWGTFKQDSGTIEGNVGRSLKDRKVMTVFPEGDYGKHAVTHWKVVRRFSYVTLIECMLETGRTHQIRVHMKHTGHPLFADSTYGGDQILKGTTSGKYRQFVNNCFQLLNRQALHATTLGFYHPVLRKNMSFSSDLPEDMQTVINKWENYSSCNQEREN